MVCLVEHCDRDAVAKGYCHRHYYAFRKYGDPEKLQLKQHHGLTLRERFDRYTKRGPGCWVWLSYRDPSGYGRLHYKRKPVLASRISYLLHFGEIPEGQHVCHKCDNPGCVNPEHLFLGSQADNMADMYRKGRDRKRSLKGEQHGQAKLTAEQVREFKQSTLSDSEAARRYGVSRATIHAIRSGKTWSHIS